MPSLQEGELTFDFPDEGSDVAKYDEWSFFRNQFQTVCGRAGGVDFIFVEHQRTWLIEVKDHRNHRRTKVADLAGEIAAKVRDTLAGLAACRCNANDTDERHVSNRALFHSGHWRHPALGTACQSFEALPTGCRSLDSDAEAEAALETCRPASPGRRSTLTSPFDALEGDVAGSGGYSSHATGVRAISKDMDPVADVHSERDCKNLRRLSAISVARARSERNRRAKLLAQLACSAVGACISSTSAAAFVFPWSVA